MVPLAPNNKVKGDIIYLFNNLIYYTFVSYYYHYLRWPYPNWFFFVTFRRFLSPSQLLVCIDSSKRSSFAPLAKKVLAMGRGSAHNVAAHSTCWEVKWPGKHPSPPVDNTSTCSNEFSQEVSGAHERICPDQQDSDVRAPRTPNLSPKIRLSTRPWCPRAETEIYVFCPGIPKWWAPSPCSWTRRPWSFFRQLFSV